MNNAMDLVVYFSDKVGWFGTFLLLALLIFCGAHTLQWFAWALGNIGRSQKSTNPRGKQS